MKFSEFGECCFQFSLLKASTVIIPLIGFFHAGGGFLYYEYNKIKYFLKDSLYSGCQALTERIMKQELIKLLLEKSFKYSEEPAFKLVSGRMSRFYVNCKPTTLSPLGMYLAGHLVFYELENTDITGVGGLTFGADPIAVATAFASQLNKKPVKAFSIRKTKKDHGIIKWIEGDMAQGEKVAIIDDVATTGGSTIKAIERARDEGLEVVKAVILVDRQEGGLENIKKYVPDVSAIVTRDELMEWREKTKS